MSDRAAPSSRSHSLLPTPPALLPGARAYRGRLLTPLSSTRGGTRYLEDALLIVTQEGRIASVEPTAESSFAGPILDVRPAVLLPGFVDAHLHYPQTRITGSASGTLLEWLERSVFPEEARFADPGYAAAVADEFIQRMLAAGTTTCAAYSSAHPGATDRLFKALCRAGMRAFAGLTLMDQACPEALRLDHRDAIPAARDLVLRWHGREGLFHVAVTPRFAPSCSRSLLEAAARLAEDHGLLIQTHLAEQPAEAEAALRAHPWATDYLDVYERVGLLGPRTLLAHCIHLSPQEWDRLAGAGASVVHCPDSNFFLGSGRMPLTEPRRRRVPVALGSDIGAGRSFDMRRAMSDAFDNALILGERLSPAELIAMATLGGAEALGLGDRIGSLEPGKDADFIVVRGPDHAASETEFLAELVFAGDWAIVQRTYVRGVLVYPRAT